MKLTVTKLDDTMSVAQADHFSVSCVVVGTTVSFKGAKAIAIPGTGRRRWEGVRIIDFAGKTLGETRRKR